MRISVTELDSYRRFRALEEMSFEELLAILLKQRPATRQMEAGKALHSVLENLPPSSGPLDVVEQDGFRFRFVCDCALALPRVRELKGEQVFQTSGGPVTLVGMVDGFNGAVHDYKLTSKFDAERYHDSFQWRCYLVMFGGTKFVYDVFVGDDKGEEIVIKEYHRLPLYAYPSMKDDVFHAVDEFARFMAEQVPQRLAA